MFEGTGKYFLILFIVFFIVYLTVKICLGKLFKEMRIPAWKAYIPFYGTLILVDILDMKKSVFYKTLIPFVNLYYYKVIIAELLKAYQLNPKEAIWFVLIPMYKFPELVFKNPKFMLHMYDETEEFLVNQNALYDTSNKDTNNDNQNGITIEKTNYNQTLTNINEKPNNINNELNSSQNNTYNNQTPNQDVNNENNTVYFNQALQPDERQETFIQAKVEEKKEEKPIVIDKSKPKVCPNCGTKLSPTATTCFLCGTKLL